MTLSWYLILTVSECGVQNIIVYRGSELTYSTKHQGTETFYKYFLDIL